MIRSSIGGWSLQLGGANAREEDATLDTLSTIITDYPEAITELFAGHRLAALIRRDAANTVETALGELGSGLLVEGSAGAGNWAAVPWISVFDPAITTSATHGYYAVYLFHVSEPIVYLSLNQGTTAVREEPRWNGRRYRQSIRGDRGIWHTCRCFRQ